MSRICLGPWVVLLVIAALLLLAISGCGPSTNSSAQDIVHATRTGKRYHRAGCRSLSKSDISMTRTEAESKGLTPCKVCKP
jgi:hypothetical protein